MRAHVSPGTGVHLTAPDFLVVPSATAATLAAGCERRVPWPAGGDGVVLVACPSGSRAGEQP